MIRRTLAVLEISILTALIIATRCANYQDVFVAGNIYFTDADCYARMTRARMVAANPGLIVRHHDFENFPQGTTPHTTAPLDYVIVGLSNLLKPFTVHAFDLAGAFVSPLFALIGGWFLWWWSRRMRFRYRWAMLILYAISPIVVHGTELGRPDHQSLLMLLVTVAICAEWSFQRLQVGCSAKICSPNSDLERAGPWWAMTSALAWALAIWVSAYEPLILFLLVTGTVFIMNRQAFFGRGRRAGWILFAAIVGVALAVERRIPLLKLSESNTVFLNWMETIGELAHVWPTNPVWFRWCGYLLLAAPVLMWMNRYNRKTTSEPVPVLVIVSLVATYGFSLWQARWGYFFVLIFAIALPALLTPIKSSVAVWIAFVVSIFPILRDWDEKLWPSETQLASRTERRIESVQIRELAQTLRSTDVRPFLAPWWLSPAISYWSGQPGTAGSSHGSLDGIADSARFFLSADLKQARDILDKDQVAWVFAYDSERVAQNSAAILNEQVPPRPVCRILYQTPSQAPPFLIFAAQNPTCKLYRVKIQR